MKKLLTLTAACVLLTAPAMAVQKCVKLTNGSTCSTGTGNQGSIEWNATCNNVPIKGIAGCAAPGNYVRGDTIESLPKSTSSSSSRQGCWCKIISPVMSAWVFATTFDSTNTCMYSCAQYCYNYLSAYPDYRSALFSTLSD